MLKLFPRPGYCSRTLILGEHHIVLPCILSDAYAAAVALWCLQWVVNGVLTLVCVEMGPTQPWGFPSPVSNPALFLDYVNAIEASGHNAFDVVMVSRKPS